MSGGNLESYKNDGITDSGLVSVNICYSDGVET